MDHNERWLTRGVVLYFVLCAAVLLLTGCAIASSGQYSGPYRGKLTVRYVSADTIYAMCLYHVKGCSLSFNRFTECQVFILKSLNQAWRKKVLEHELEHCNGRPPEGRS